MCLSANLDVILVKLQVTSSHYLVAIQGQYFHVLILTSSAIYNYSVTVMIKNNRTLFFTYFYIFTFLPSVKKRESA